MLIVGGRLDAAHGHTRAYAASAYKIAVGDQLLQGSIANSRWHGAGKGISRKVDICNGVAPAADFVWKLSSEFVVAQVDGFQGIQAAQAGWKGSAQEIGAKVEDFQECEVSERLGDHSGEASSGNLGSQHGVEPKLFETVHGSDV